MNWKLKQLPIMVHVIYTNQFAIKQLTQYV